MADAADEAFDITDAALNLNVQRVTRAYEGKEGSEDCEDCGNEIPQARRQHAPWATTCVDCQSIREAKDKHRRVA